MARCSSLVGKKLAGGWWSGVGSARQRRESVRSRMKRQDGGDAGHGEGGKRAGDGEARSRKRG